MNFFEFTRSDYEIICNECMLDDDYKKLLEYKIKGYSIVKIADELHVSTSKVSTMVKNLKEKIRKIM